MKYNIADTSLTNVYLFDQGEKDLKVFQMLWDDPTLTMNDIAGKVDSYRKTLEYKDHYPQFARHYDTELNREAMQFCSSPDLYDKQTLEKLFFVANERLINPEKILKAVDMDELMKAPYYKAHFGENLELLKENVSMNTWNRLMADTIYFHYKNNYESNMTMIFGFQEPVLYGDSPFFSITDGFMLLRAKENLKQTIINYQAVYDELPVREAISKMTMAKNPEMVVNIMNEYKNDMDAISEVVDHLLKQTQKKENEETLAASSPHSLMSLNNPDIMTALTATVYFQQIVGVWFERQDTFGSCGTTDKKLAGMINAYLQYVDAEIIELEENIAKESLNVEIYKDSLEKHKYCLEDFQQISSKGHRLMDFINTNLKIRNKYENIANKGHIAANDMRTMGAGLTEIPDFIRKKYFKDLYGTQLENLCGRDLSKGDIFLILRYKEYLAARIDAAENRIKVLCDGHSLDKKEFGNLWSAYTVDSKLLETVNDSLRFYSSAVCSDSLPGIVQLVYHPDNGEISMETAMNINPESNTTLILDPFISQTHAEQFIESFTQKCTALKITYPVGYPVIISELKCWNQQEAWKSSETLQRYETLPLANESEQVLPANLRKDMEIFHNMEKQYAKYIEEIKYDIDHPEFIGKWKTDENYRDLEKLTKKSESQNSETMKGHKR